MVETIQHMEAASSPLDLPNPSIGEWTTNWARMPSSAEFVEPTKLQEVRSTSPSKIIFMDEIFQDINKQMLEINYTLILDS
jgi:hypothetical protein